MDERQDLVEIDLSDVTSPEQLHSRLAQSLNFPDFYGRNWDAFWDSITGLVTMPRHLRFVGWLSLRDRLPRDAGHLRSCLEDMEREFPAGAPTIDFGD
jgi:ribonuclease inhibitor